VINFGDKPYTFAGKIIKPKGTLFIGIAGKE
jgi:hypothetical protein